MVIKSWRSEDLGLEIEVDYYLCEGCGDCKEACPSEVYALVDGKSTAPNIRECIECYTCVEACPNAAIRHTVCEA